MGMPLSKYGLLYDLISQKTPSFQQHREENPFRKFRLFGLILHDPNYHLEFADFLAESFERLDYLTGQDFLFFALTSPGRNWKQKHFRKSVPGFWGDAYVMIDSERIEDNSISVYTISQSLNIPYTDLPVIVLTNNLKFNQYRVIKTCSEHLKQQLTETGFLCSSRHSFFSIISDPEFNNLIRRINLCHGEYIVKNDEPLAETIADYLVLSESDNSSGKSHHERNVIRKIFTKPFDGTKTPQEIKRFSLGYLKNLKSSNDFKSLPEIVTDNCRTNEIISYSKNPKISEETACYINLDDRCERESRIILDTFNKIFPHFQAIKATWGADYSPLIIELFKIFEIESNLSVVQWIRNYLGIEMPEFFNKRKPTDQSFTFTPELDTFSSEGQNTVDFNRGPNNQGNNKWYPPPTGSSELVARTLHSRGTSPEQFQNFGDFLVFWNELRRKRNSAAHQSITMRNDLDSFLNIYRGFISRSFYNQMFSLKNNLREIM